MRQPILIFCNSSTVQGRFSILRAVITIRSLYCMLHANWARRAMELSNSLASGSSSTWVKKSKAGVSVFFTPGMNDSTAIPASERPYISFVQPVLRGPIDRGALWATEKDNQTIHVTSGLAISQIKLSVPSSTLAPHRLRRCPQSAGAPLPMKIRKRCNSCCRR